jgi:hypothetical protein
MSAAVILKSAATKPACDRQGSLSALRERPSRRTRDAPIRVPLNFSSYVDLFSIVTLGSKPSRLSNHRFLRIPRQMDDCRVRLYIGPGLAYNHVNAHEGNLKKKEKNNGCEEESNEETQ